MSETEPSNASSDTQSTMNGGAPPNGYSVYRFIHEPDPPLETCLNRFWSVQHPLTGLPEFPPLSDKPFEILKRLGPSPFEASAFPLIGFLATAYERVSRFARERASE